MHLQCATVDGLRDYRGHANLPNVLDGSKRTACQRCRKAVWLSMPAQVLVKSDRTVVLVCEVCKPAATVGPIAAG